MAAQTFSALLGLAAVAATAGCDADDGKPKPTLAERERDALVSKSKPIIEAHAAAFKTVAELLASGEPTEQACPADAVAGLEGAAWGEAPGIALSERALTWFVASPAESTSDPETVPAWAEGAEGVLNDDVLADRDRVGIDGARLSLLRELWLWSRHGPTAERTSSGLKARVWNKFKDDDPPGPTYVVLVRDLVVTEPKLPIAPPADKPTPGSIEALQASVKKDGDPPTLKVDAAGLAKQSFVGGTMTGWVEVYDVAAARRLCAQRVEAKNSERIKSYFGRDRAVPTDLGQEFLRAANAAIGHPVGVLPARKTPEGG